MTYEPELVHPNLVPLLYLIGGTCCAWRATRAPKMIQVEHGGIEVQPGTSLTELPQLF